MDNSIKEQKLDYEWEIATENGIREGNYRDDPYPRMMVFNWRAPRNWLWIRFYKSTKCPYTGRKGMGGDKILNDLVIV